MPPPSDPTYEHLRNTLYSQTVRDPHGPVCHTTTMSNSSTLDFSRGCMYIQNGKAICSPNTTRAVDPPPPRQENTTLFFDTTLESPMKLHQPRWWSEETAFLAFVSISPKYTGLGVSLPLPPYRDPMETEMYSLSCREKRGYGAEPWRKLAWASVERRMLMMIDSMAVKYNLPPVREVVKDPLRLKKTYQHIETFRADANRTIKWFSPIAAQMSWAIAIACSLDGEIDSGLTDVSTDSRESRRPRWLDHLASLRSIYWDEAMLQAVRKCMGDFASYNPKVGVFIDITNPPRYQYSVDWLVQFNIPVYYIWDDVAILCSLREPSSELGRFTPPVHLAQELLTGLQDLYQFNTLPAQERLREALRIFRANNAIVDDHLREPSFDFPSLTDDPLPMPHEVERSSTPLPTTICVVDHPASSDSDAHSSRNSNSGAELGKWQAYLAKLIAATVHAEKTESDKARHARLQRERNPPTVNTRVFVWELEDGECKRTAVRKSENDNTLCDLRPSQKLYNAVLNEWNCSYDFKVNADADDGDFEDSDDDMYRAGFHNNTADSLADFPSPPATLASDKDLRDVASSDMLSLFRDYYGYVPPLPPVGQHPTSDTAPVSDTVMMHLRNFVGMTKDECLGVQQSLLQDLQDFIATILKHTNKALPLDTSIDSWDLVFGNRQYVGGLTRIRSLRQIQGSSDTTFFLYDLGMQRREEWFLAVCSPIAAIFVCQLSASWSERDICIELLRRGIAFHTLLPLRHIAPSPRFPTSADVLPANYVFSKRDYEMYLDFRADMLNNNRVLRAALMRGGIVWRLSISHANGNDESVLAGPTDSVRRHAMGLAFDNGSLQDDFIALDKLNMICGTYECLTGKGLQTVTMSWWPPYTIWVQCFDYDYWTHLMEAKFRLRLRELDAGTAAPMSKKQWRTWVRGGKITRDAKTCMNNASVEFLSRTVFSSS